MEAQREAHGDSGDKLTGARQGDAEHCLGLLGRPGEDDAVLGPPVGSTVWSSSDGESGRAGRAELGDGASILQRQLRVDRPVRLARADDSADSSWPAGVCHQLVTGSVATAAASGPAAADHGTAHSDDGAAASCPECAERCPPAALQHLQPARPQEDDLPVSSGSRCVAFSILDAASSDDDADADDDADTDTAATERAAGSPHSALLDLPGTWPQQDILPTARAGERECPDQHVNRAADLHAAARQLIEQRVNRADATTDATAHAAAHAAASAYMPSGGLWSSHVPQGQQEGWLNLLGLHGLSDVPRDAPDQLSAAARGPRSF